MSEFSATVPFIVMLIGFLSGWRKLATPSEIIEWVEQLSRAALAVILLPLCWSEINAV